MKPSLEEIKSWREERRALSQEYKPMPSAAKFKSLKIPKLNKKLGDCKKTDDFIAEENVEMVAKVVNKNITPVKSGTAMTSRFSSSK